MKYKEKRPGNKSSRRGEHRYMLNWYTHEDLTILEIQISSSILPDTSH